MPTKDEQQHSFLTDRQLISNYQIIRRLGKGAMGQVYLAEQIHVGRRPVALKILNPECAANPQLVKRFESEAATAGRIHHRNVVTVYESRLTDQGHFYVAMEYVAGRTLREELAARGALPLSEVVEITKQICAGLGAAHKMGVVHRDIKPDNIMLVRSDEDAELTVKVLDFGIARLAESQATSMQTAPGLIIGTPAYLSPEQAAGAIGNQIDARADIYSLGMVIYEMITGRVAFYSDSWLAIVRQQLYDPPPSPSKLATGVQISPAIEQVVMRALEKDRERRQQTATQFARELEQAYAEYIASTDKLDPQSKGETTRLAKPKSSVEQAKGTSWKLFAGASSLLLILIAAGFWLFANRKDQPVAATPTATISPSPSPATPSVPPVHLEVMNFRVTRKDAVDKLKTLPLDLTVKSGERISFEFNLASPGAVYLMLENDDHSWRWLDAAANGQVAISAADRWIVLPQDSWYVLDDNAGLEKFWTLYVPRGADSSLADLIASNGIAVERNGRWEGSATLKPEQAEAISNWLKANAVELKATGNQVGKEVIFNLWQDAELSKASFYRIELKHIQ